MQTVLEQLYMIELDDEMDKNRNLLDMQEEQIYDGLRNSLTKEQQKLFDEFVELISDRFAIAQENFYRYGFKTAMVLVKELQE